VTIFAATIPIALGLDPLKLTIFSMTLTAASLPLTVAPFLFLLNDESYMGQHRNGVISNTAVLFVVALGFILAVVTIPLQILGGS